MAFPICVSRSFMFLLIALVANLSRVSAVVTDQFTNWYPQFRTSFEHTRDANCSDEYKAYRSGDRENATIDIQNGGDSFTVLTQPLIDCLLKNTSEFIKSNMTSAQVLLGVMPTVLSLLSASTEEMAILACVGRRPILVLLLGFGSPSSYFSRAFSYSNIHELMEQRIGRMSQYRPKRGLWAWVISAAEYSAAFGLGANVVHCSWEVGIRAVSSVSTESAFLPPLWVGLGVIVQIFGACVFRLRAQGWRDLPELAHKNSRDAASRLKFGTCNWLRGILSRLAGILQYTELLPSATEGLDAAVAVLPETKVYLVLAWVQSTIAVLHVVMGTLVYSSMMFMGTRDALVIVVRFLVATLICRVIVMYELAGVRESCGKNVVSVERDNSLGKTLESDSNLMV